MGRYEDAIKEFDIAIRIDKNYADAHFFKGVALTDIGKYQDAIREFDIAIELNPNEKRYSTQRDALSKHMKNGESWIDGSNLRK